MPAVPPPLLPGGAAFDPPIRTGSAGANELTLEHFSGQEFDPVTWLNANLSNIGSLSTSLQLLCQDEQESVDDLAQSVVQKLPTTLLHLETLRKEVETGHRRVQQAIKELSRAGKDSFPILTDMAVTKERLEVAKVALRELQTWDKKVQEVDDLLRGGELVQVIERIRGAQDVCECFAELPEYEQRVGSLRNFESELKSLARRKLLLALEKGNFEDLRVATEAFQRCDLNDELNHLVANHFENLALKVKPSSGGSNSGSASGVGVVVEHVSASAMGEAIRLCFESLVTASREIARVNKAVASLPGGSQQTSSSSSSPSVASPTSASLVASANLTGGSSAASTTSGVLQHRKEEDAQTRKRLVYQKLKHRARQLADAEGRGRDAELAGERPDGEDASPSARSPLLEAGDLAMLDQVTPDLGRTASAQSAGSAAYLQVPKAASTTAGGSSLQAEQQGSSSSQATLKPCINLQRALVAALRKLHGLLYESMNADDGNVPAEDLVTRKTSRILASWISYVDGAENLSATLADSNSEAAIETMFRELPYWLLLDTVKFVYVPGLQDCRAKKAEKRATTGASELLLTAESESLKHMQALAKFAIKDDVYLLSSAEFVALSAVDSCFAASLSEVFPPLGDIFENSIQERSTQNAIDATVLNLCLSFYKVLSHVQTQMVNELEQPLLDHCRMQGAESRVYPHFAQALEWKFLKEGIKEIQSAFRKWPLEKTYEDRRLHQSRSRVAELLQRARKLVGSACVAPIQNVLSPYASLSVWAAEDPKDATPQQLITNVGEQLFGMVPMLEHSGLVEEWLHAALQEVAKLTVSNALQIARLSAGGFSQLKADLEYVFNVISALCTSKTTEGGTHGSTSAGASQDSGSVDELQALFSLVNALKKIDSELAQTGNSIAAMLAASQDNKAGDSKYERTVKQMLKNFASPNVGA
ncbi:unnamed protein product [Amoebophrya sp. A25]|nr:unnamed protein product [Amoebophrya sp. A25]|eukprot:GSA25T00015012001.1